jgi:hypothetical protein
LYKTTVSEIKRQARINGFTEFHWSFSGGEPTAYKHLLELTRHLDDGAQTPYQSIHMTTNLSPSINWWKNWAVSTELLQRRSITASFHDEFAKEQEFGDKIIALMYEGVHVTINQVMVPDTFYQLYDRLERFKKRGINVTLKPQSNSTATAIVDGYSDVMMGLMREYAIQQSHGMDLHQIALYEKDDTVHFIDQAERFNAFGFNKFTDWDCNAGYQSVIIKGNEIKRGYSCHDMPLGTLDSGFELFNSSRTCITPSCVSSADSKIPKNKHALNINT